MESIERSVYVCLIPCSRFARLVIPLIHSVRPGHMCPSVYVCTCLFPTTTMRFDSIEIPRWLTSNKIMQFEKKKKKKTFYLF